MELFNFKQTVCFKLGLRILGANQSAVLHVLLQPLHRLPAHAFTFGTGDSAFGHNLQVPTLLLASWWMSAKTKTIFYTVKIFHQPI